MNVKYQVFISSTYEDLKAERDQVVKAVLEMGNIPVGMEMFSAADEQQWQIISRYIENTDYYVVIVAHRYGSMEGKLSFTEKEYDYAIKCGVPVLGFVIDEAVAWPPAKSDQEPQKRKALARFKEKVKSKYISYWKSTDDLYGKVSIALNKAITSRPRTGWVRANEQVVSKDVIDEIARLSKENSDLHAQLKAATLNADREGLAPWKEFIDKAYDFIRARDKVKNYSSSFPIVFEEQKRERKDLEEDAHKKMQELDKTYIKSALEFRGTAQEINLRQAHVLLTKLVNSRDHQGDIMKFVEFLTAGRQPRAQDDAG